MIVPSIERVTHAVALYLSERTDLDVSQAEAHVLAYMHGRASAGISEIHEAFGHRRSTLTSVLDRLETRKLIKRTTDAENRRSVLVMPTPAGRSLAKKVFEALHAFEAQALRGCSEDDIEAFRRVVTALG